MYEDENTGKVVVMFWISCVCVCTMLYWLFHSKTAEQLKCTIGTEPTVIQKVK
jgi:hypothetical protein